MRSVTTELHRWIAHELVVQRNPWGVGDPLVLKWCEAPFSAGASLWLESSKPATEEVSWKQSPNPVRVA